MLTDLRKLGPLLGLYAGGIGAVARENYAALHGVTQAVARSDRSDINVPIVAAYVRVQNEPGVTANRLGGPI